MYPSYGWKDGFLAQTSALSHNISSNTNQNFGQYQVHKNDRDLWLSISGNLLLLQYVTCTKVQPVQQTIHACMLTKTDQIWVGSFDSIMPTILMTEKATDRERERQRDRQTETERQTERQRDRQTDRQTDGRSDWETDRQMDAMKSISSYHKGAGRVIKIAVKFSCLGTFSSDISAKTRLKHSFRRLCSLIIIQCLLW